MQSQLTWDVWQTASTAEHEQIAQQVAAQMGDGFHWVDLQRYELGDSANTVARFECEQIPFVLVPGRQLTLGFSGHYEPTAEQAASWADTAAGYNIDQTLDEYLAALLTPRRTATIPTLLVEVKPVEVSASPFAPETHTDLLQMLKDQGFRLATTDEWEYFCGAGSVTLFRWGKDSPGERYPTALTYRAPTEPFQHLPYAWDLHVRLNAFGLQIASNPYNVECVAEPGVFRGGDGGTSICGGMGAFAGWLPLATAYQDPYLHECFGDYVTETSFRRVKQVELTW